MNAKTLALRIAKLEGKKRQVSIAQISEILKITLTQLAMLDNKELEALLKRYR